MKTLRLSGALNQSLELIDAANTLSGLSPAAKMELEWEAMCCTAQRTGGLAPMLRAVQQRGSHHASVYVIESSFWCRAFATKACLEGIPATTWMLRSKKINPKNEGYFFKAAVELEGCYDYEPPLVLGVGGDKLEKTWFTNREQEPEAPASRLTLLETA